MQLKFYNYHMKRSDGTAKCRVAEVNSLNLDKLPGRF